MASVPLFLFLLLSVLSAAAASKPIPPEVGKGEKLVEALQRAIEAKDRRKIGDFFEDDFTFKGCTRDFTKEDAINLVAALGAQMTRIVQNHTKIAYISGLKFVATCSETFIPMSAEFHVSSNWRIASGNSLLCDKKL